MMLTVNTWLLLVAAGMISFFLAYLKLDKDKAAISYIFSIMFFMVSGVSSFSLEYVTDSGVATTDANAVVGLILIPWALIAAGLALGELADEATELAGV